MDKKAGKALERMSTMSEAEEGIARERFRLGLDYAIRGIGYILREEREVVLDDDLERLAGVVKNFTSGGRL